MYTIRRGGSEDTGEQDVRELRRRFAEPTPITAPETYTPRQEDASHDTASSNFCGVVQGDEVSTTLAEMVDSGELHLGWDEQRQEFVYWVPEGVEISDGCEEEEDVFEPIPVPALSSTRTRGHRRAPKPRSSICRRTVMAVVASLAPFFIGVAAEAAISKHAYQPGMDHPDVTGNDWEQPEPDPTPNYRPATGGSGTVAKRTSTITPPTEQKAQDYVGKHRKNPSEAEHEAAEDSVERAEPGNGNHWGKGRGRHRGRGRGNGSNHPPGAGEGHERGRQHHESHEDQEDYVPEVITDVVRPVESFTD
jgi:hypothetical protein